MMGADSSSKPSAVKVLVLSIHQEMGEAFVKGVCGSVAEGAGKTDLKDQPVHLEVLAGDPRLNPSWDETARKADVMILLTRFLDVISLDKIKAIYRRLPSDRMIPMGVLTFREKEESDYKMSCPACGQKLWVHDADIDKRGRCPNCKKAFKLPSQANLIKSQLMLPDTVPLAKVINGSEESCREAVANLLGRLSGSLFTPSPGVDQETLKKTTVRVQVSPEDTNAG